MAAEPEVIEARGDADAEMLVALRHELRRKILGSMLRQEGPVSPRWLQADLKEPLSNISYHVRVLADCKAVTLVDTKPVRGSVKHFYLPSVEQPWALAILGFEGGDEEATPPPAGGASPAEERSR